MRIEEVKRIIKEVEKQEKKITKKENELDLDKRELEVLQDNLRKAMEGDYSYLEVEDNSQIME